MLSLQVYNIIEDLLILAGTPSRDWDMASVRRLATEHQQWATAQPAPPAPPPPPPVQQQQGGGGRRGAPRAAAAGVAIAVAAVRGRGGGIILRCRRVDMR